MYISATGVAEAYFGIYFCADAVSLKNIPRLIILIPIKDLEKLIHGAVTILTLTKKLSIFILRSVSGPKILVGQDDIKPQRSLKQS